MRVKGYLIVSVMAEHDYQFFINWGNVVSMKRITNTICLTLAALLGSASLNGLAAKVTILDANGVSKRSLSPQEATLTPPKATTPPTEVIVPHTQPEVTFIYPEVTLWSDPLAQSPKKVVKQAIGKKATLIKQGQFLLQIRFEGEDSWVYRWVLDRNLKPAIMEVLFKVSDVNLRTGPGVQFPTAKVLKDAKYRRAAPFGKSGNWVHIVFDKHPYWVHSSLIYQNETAKKSTEPANQGGNQLSYFEQLNLKAAAGDPKAMELIGLLYELKPGIHFEFAYMWLSLAIDNADPTSKVRLKKHLDKQVLPRLDDRQIALTRKKLQRCKESNYTDCGTTSFKIFQKQ